MKGLSTCYLDDVENVRRLPMSSHPWGYFSPGTIEERDKKRISFYGTMLVAVLVGCVRDDRMKGQETASFRL